ATAADSADEPDETFRVVLSSPGGGAAIGTAEAVGTINDDDDPPVLSISAAPVDEGADGETATMTFTVALAPASGKQVKVNYADSGTGSATSGEDYDALTSGTLTFNAGQTSKTFTVTVNGDAVDEGDETVIARLSSPVNATLKGGGQTLDGEGVIRDDEGPLTATLALSRTSIKESGDGNSATVTASINGVSNEAIKLTVASSPVSPATAADFSLSANKVLTIAAGQRQSTGTVSVTAVDNDIDAADKSLTVSATIMGGHMAQAPANVTLAIEDNDERGVDISESALTLAEASGSDTYDVVLTSEPTANVVINVASSDTGAAKVSPNKLTFAPADWDDPQTVTVTAVNDTVDNPNDQRAATISHSVAAGTSDYTGVSAASVAVTVTDDDLAPGGIALSVSPASVSESAGATTVTVTATVAGETAYAEDKTVSVTVGETDDSAVSGEDYVAVTGFSITIAKGAMSASEDFSLNPTQDSLDEINETLTVAGTESGGAVVDSATVTIEDKNDPPTLSIDAPAADEGGDRDRNPLRFTVSLSAASGKQVTVAYAEVAGTGQNVATSGEDYLALASGTLTFNPGQTSKTIDVTMRGDRIDENDETLKVRLSLPVNATFAGSATSLDATGTIRDDDDAPKGIELSVEPASVAESAGADQSIRVTATVDGNTTYAEEMTVAVTVGDNADSAVEGDDYQPVPGFSFTIAAGAESGSGTFLFTPIADVVQELQGEQVSIIGESGSVNVTPAVLTISDKAPVTIAPARAAEGDVLEFAVTLPDPAPAGGLTVSYQTLEGRGNGGGEDYQTATADDFADGDGGSITIGAGARTGTVHIDTFDDAVYESEHYLRVRLTGTSHTDDFPVIKGADSAVGAITDDGDLPVFSFTSPDNTVAEDAGTVTLAVAKAGDTLVPATLTWATVAGSAEAGMDFEAASGPLEFGPDVFEMPVSVVVLDDAVSDVNERFSVMLEAVAHAALGQASAAINIEDNDDALELRIVSLEDEAVTEGGAARFALRTERTPEKDIVAELMVAQSGSYLSAGESGARQVTLRTGALEEAFLVATEDDALDEPDGSVTVTLAAGQGYRVPPAPDDAATVAVVDDDLGESPGVDISTAKLEIGEGAEARYSVALKTDPGQAVSIEVRSEDETAVAVAPATLVFAEGEWSAPQAVTVTAVDDPDDESERVLIRHEVSGYPGLEEVADVAVEVADDDWTARQVNLEVEPATIIEGGHVAVTANLSGPPGSDVAVPIVLSAQSAEPGDFRPETGIDIHIGARATMGRDTVATVVDGDADNDTFVITLGELPEGLEAGSSRSVQVTIVDNQTRGVQAAARWWNALGAEARLRALYGNVSAADRDRLLAWVQHGFDFLEDEMRSRVLFEAIDLLGGNGYRSVADWWQSLSCRLRRVAVGDGKVSDASSPWCADWPQLDAGQRDEAARVGRALLADSQLPLGDEPPDAAELAFSVADARVDEAPGAALEFVVRVSEPPPEAVSVAYATRDGTATAGEDYDETQGVLHFAPGDTEQTVSVAVHDDVHDEGEETLTLELSAPEGAVLDRAVATGTIVNSDPLPAAWLARFGRTVAEQAIEGVADRIAAPRTPGFEGAIAGQPLGQSAEQAVEDEPDGGPPAGRSAFDDIELAMGFGCALGGGPGAAPARGPAPAGQPGAAVGQPGASNGRGMAGGDPCHDGPGLYGERGMRGRDVLVGSAFTLTRKEDAAGGTLAFWGQAAHTSFRGRQDALDLDGEVTTALLGTDYARGKWLLGLALAHSEGRGGYSDAALGAGGVASSLTAAIPYLSYKASPRWSLWGAAGYGAGEVITGLGIDDQPAAGPVLSAGIDWRMAAAGVRGDLLVPVAGGLALAVVSDALWAGTGSERTEEMIASDSAVTRLRLGLEGSWSTRLGAIGSLTPKLEAGLRHDGGDADAGFGVEVGAGLAWNAPQLGLSLDLKGRTLLAHEAAGRQDRGFSAALSFDPGSSELGPSFKFGRELGGRPEGGVQALFEADPLGLQHGGAATGRWTAETAWGFPVFGDRFIGRPHVGYGLSTTERDYTLGWQLKPLDEDAPDLTLGVQTKRRESEGEKPDHGIELEIKAQW
ncbi:MAG: hypothetical protein F4Z84_06690, partial [Gammaproteobacteria bacterium]|nr:hypothetical protein [Gammaproteobacteria bacterium]